MKKTLLKTMLFGGLLTASTAAVAQGFYMPIPYYGNDPFIFCTFGVPSDCWLPLDPVTGAFTVTDPECFNPVSAALYARVCPMAFIPSGASAVALPPRLPPLTTSGHTAQQDS